MISLVESWSHLFSPLEAAGKPFLISHTCSQLPHLSCIAGTVGPMIWREALASQFKFDGHRREALAKFVHRMAWECVSKCPSACALHSLSLCKSNWDRFYRIS